MKRQKEYRDSEWTDTIIGLMRLRVPEQGSDRNWPGDEQLDSATRLAMRLSSADLIPPASVGVAESGDAMFKWHLSDTSREVIIGQDSQADFRVIRATGDVAFSMKMSVTGDLDLVLNHWLDSWINCLG